MIILTNFCGGTTFHQLWYHQILPKCDDWILHVSEVRLGNRSRIQNKLYIITQTVFNLWILNIDSADGSDAPWRAWRSWFASWYGSRNFMFMLIVKTDSFWKLIQFSKRTWNAIIILSLSPLAAVWFEHRTIVCQGRQNTHWATDVTFSWQQRPNALYLLQDSSGDFTTVEMNCERPLNNSCSQSLARKRDS